MIEVSKDFVHKHEVVELQKTIKELNLSSVRFTYCYAAGYDPNTYHYKYEINSDDYNKLNKFEMKKYEEFEEQKRKEWKSKSFFQKAKERILDALEGWKLWDDGTRTRQGIKHTVILCKYENEE